MADEEYYDDEELDQEMLGEDADTEDYLEEDDNTEMVAGVSGWTISIIVHGVILLILGAIVIAAQLEKEKPPIRVATLEAPEEIEQEEPEERTVEEVEVEIDAEEIVEDPIVTDLDVPEEVTETEDEEVTEVEEPKGREEAVSDAEAGGAAAFMAIGAGGGAKGAMGNRSGGGRKRAVGRNGGSRRSESAVEAALRWFKRHQSPDGSWDVDGYQDNCTDNPKCEPGTQWTDKSGDVGCSAYALMCFLGAGYDHKTPSKYRTVVDNGLKWLRGGLSGPNKKMAATGVTGKSWAEMSNRGRSYAHAIATYALCEAYGMTMDASMRNDAQAVVDFCVSSQNKNDGVEYGGFGWDYMPKHPERNDSSVTGWYIMAIKAAAGAGLNNTSASIEASKMYLDKAWKAANKDWENLDPYGESEFPYVYDAVVDSCHVVTQGQKAGKARINMAPVGALCCVFLGHGAGDTMFETLLNRCASTYTPQGFPTNSYFLYYNTLAMFQAGGERWKKWNGTVRDLIVTNQRKKGSGCFDGSWDVGSDHGGNHIDGTGRLLCTAYYCLCLEVYYRYARMADLKH